MQPSSKNVSPPEFGGTPGAARRHRKGLPDVRKRVWLGVLGGCVLLSLLLHFTTGRWLELRSWEEAPHDLLVWVDIVAPKPAPPAPPSPPVPEMNIPPEPLPGRSPARKGKPAPMVPAPVAVPAAPEQTERAAGKPVDPQPGISTAPSSRPPVGQIVAQPGVTVLANESGQDTLKHGAEARFMHGLATEEFVEENYVGAYSLGAGGRVWIEDDRAGSGHLILHAEHMGLVRPLFRYNRFIYVYGESPDSPEPILGTVTFFSDGYHIHQFLWQHNATHAYYPRRIPE